MLDAHCHLDFMSTHEAQAAARGAHERGLSCLSCTVEPRGYTKTHDLLVSCPGVVVGLGLHPWWVSADETERTRQLELFDELAPSASLVGEVGLDFGAAHAATRDAQREAFAHICRASARHAASSPRVLSIHSVRAAGAALDILEETGALKACTCIFHWFSGTSEELACAVRAGCFFSAGPRMLATKRGRAYARSIPARRLLAETDLPARPGERLDPAEQLRLIGETERDLAALHPRDAEELGRAEVFLGKVFKFASFQSF